MPQISATVSWHFFSFLFGRMRDPARAKRIFAAQEDKKVLSLLTG